MAGEQAGASGTPAEPGTPPPAGTSIDLTPPPASTAPAAGGEPQAGGAEPISLEKAKEMRQEANSLRQRLAAAEKKAAELENAQLSEQDRVKKRAAELEGENARLVREARTLRTRMAVERHARTLNLVDEDAAYRLLDHDAITYGEDGAPQNITPLLEALVKDKPYLVRQEPAALTIGSGYPQTPKPANGRQLTDAARKADELAAFQSAGRGWGARLGRV